MLSPPKKRWNPVKWTMRTPVPSGERQAVVSSQRSTAATQRSVTPQPPRLTVSVVVAGYWWRAPPSASTPSEPVVV